MKKIPSIKSVMTPFPFWIEASATIDTAKKMMDEHNVRHLPVKAHNQLLGVISERDIKNVTTIFPGSKQDAIALTVSDICNRDLFKVEMDEALDKVLLEMANRHLGSVLVVKHDRLAGVFTTNDACRCFGEFLVKQFRADNGGNNHDGGDDAA